MNKPAQVLWRQHKRIAEGISHLSQAASADVRNDCLRQLALDCEILASHMRKLLIQFGAAERETVFKQICTLNGYEVRSEGADTVVKLPPLPLKDRDNTNCHYLVDPLLCGLEGFVRETNHPRYDRCVVQIKHIFPPTTPLRRLHDYDNIEVKKVLDAIALYLLTDDNIRRCQVHHSGEIGNELATEIRISPLNAGDK